MPEETSDGERLEARIRMLEARPVEAVARAVCELFEAKRGRPVWIAEDRDFYAQMADDYHAAAEMAESVNHAQAIERDGAIAACLALTAGETWLRAVAEELNARCAAARGYRRRVLEELLSQVLRAAEDASAGE